jgi:predicted dehydrogenase
MLDQEPGLNAVLIATPDFWHADHTVACLQAGKHVYCEKMMADTVDNARRMAQAAKDTGKLLQIGHQRRSNPRYRDLLNGLIKLHNADSTDPLERRAILGRITHAYAQWNRSKSSSEIKEPKAAYQIDEAILQQYGYKNMYEFLNWRWFKAYSAGPISDLGAHQIDIFNWFLGTTPSGVMAAGGTDYFQNNEHLDNIMVIYDYNTAQGVARGYYQVLTTTSANGFFERFMGDDGTVQISEDPSSNRVYREAHAEAWEGLVTEGLLKPAWIPDEPGVEYKAWEKPRTWALQAKPWVVNTKPPVAVTDARDSTRDIDAYDLPTILGKPSHQPHLENFFEAVRANDKALLNCPAEEAFKTCVAVLRVNEAVAAQQRLAFAPEDFVV